MRLPLSKVYRAFPELDRFSDQQCEAFLQRVPQTERFGNISAWIILCAMIGVVVCAAVHIAFGGPFMDWAVRRMTRPRAELALGAVIMAWWFTLVPITGLIGRDCFVRRELRHAICRRIERVRCSQCKYSLLGQQLRAGRIVCPECGGTTTLAALGLAGEADLLPPDANSPEAQSPIDR